MRLRSVLVTFLVCAPMMPSSHTPSALRNSAVCCSGQESCGQDEICVDTGSPCSAEMIGSCQPIPDVGDRLTRH